MSQEPPGIPPPSASAKSIEWPRIASKEKWQKFRQESWQDVPSGRPQGEPYRWWRLHDHYGPASKA